jgi:hypothetical protein
MLVPAGTLKKEELYGEFFVLLGASRHLFDA